MNPSKIEWTDYTSNPIRALCPSRPKLGWMCAKVSPGCAQCYSERMNLRCRSDGRGIGNGLTYTDDNAAKVAWILAEHELAVILASRGRPKKDRVFSGPVRVFLGDMTDLFHERVGFDNLDWVFAAMALRPDLTFMLLTKRPARMREYLSQPGLAARFSNVAAGLRVSLPPKQRSLTDPLRIHPNMGGLWPLPNVQLGVSVEDQTRADERIPILLQCPAGARFVSYEPALGPADLTPWLGQCMPCPKCGRWECQQCYDVGGADDGQVFCNGCGEQVEMDCRRGLDGVIAGGESGPAARPAHPDWFRSVRDQCAAAGVPFFFKQWGEWIERISDNWVKYEATDKELDQLGFLEGCSGRFTMVRDLPRHPREIHCTEVDCWVERVGRKAAGRLLDGREHNELPGGAA